MRPSPQIQANLPLKIDFDILAQIDGDLAMAGTDKTSIVIGNIWLRNISAVNEMNSAWEAWVDPKQPPARATFESWLAADNIRAEIQIRALV